MGIHQKSSPPLNQTTYAAKFVVVVGDKRVLEVKLEEEKTATGPVERIPLIIRILRGLWRLFKIIEWILHR